MSQKIGFLLKYADSINKNVAIVWRFPAILHKLLLFESAMTSEGIMAASLNIIGGQGTLKKQKFVQKSSETAENQFE